MSNTFVQGGSPPLRPLVTGLPGNIIFF